MTSCPRRVVVAALLACGLAGPSADAAVRHESPLSDKAVRHTNLHIPTQLQPASELQGELAARIGQDLAALQVGGNSAFYDARAGRLTSLLLSEPLVPGTGVGNTLQWPAGIGPRDEEAVREIAWNALRAYLQNNPQFRIDVAELGTPRITVVEDATIIQISVPRVVGGIPVRGGLLNAVVNNGNLVLLGLDHWADAPRSEAGPTAVSESQAQQRLTQHVSPWQVEAVERGRLEYVPMVAGDGYEFRLT